MISFAGSRDWGGSKTPSSRSRAVRGRRAAGDGKDERVLIRHLIGGAAVESREHFESLNPATQEVLAEVARGGEAEVDAAVAAATAAFPAWAARPAAARAAPLGKL